MPALGAGGSILTTSDSPIPGGHHEPQIEFQFEAGLHMAFTEEARAKWICDYLRTAAEIETAYPSHYSKSASSRSKNASHGIQFMGATESSPWERNRSLWLNQLFL